VALLLRSRRTYHSLTETEPTNARPIGTAEVTRKVSLPGAVEMTLTVTAEALADGTVGPGTVIDWHLSGAPQPGPDTADGAFYNAWLGAIQQAIDDALQMAIQTAITPARPTTLTASLGLAGGPSLPCPPHP
jgi:hypothetical protein